MVNGQLQDFLHYLKFEKRYSAHTIKAYQTDLEQYCAYLLHEFELSSPVTATHFHLRSWLAGIKSDDQSARTINRKISSLNAWYKFLLRNGHISRNPVSRLHAMKLPERLPQWLKEKDTEQLLDDITFDEGFKGFTDRLICELLYATGMRRGELLGLTVSNIEWSLKQIRVLGKGNKERLMPVSDALLDTLRQYLEAKKEIADADEVHLLVLESGAPIYAGYMYRVVKHYLSTVTTMRKKSPHVMRHTFATHLLNNGANIQAIKDLLGHSSLAATQIYTHNNIDKLKQIHRLNHPRA
jgi:integrase/recombinase XerC